MKSVHKFIANFNLKNSQSTPPAVIVDQMNEPRALPMGMAEFEEWSDRIISGALVPASPRSLKFALAEMVMHLKPTESHCADAYFIHCLRKGATNQVCWQVMQDYKAQQKAENEELIKLAKEKLEKEEAEKAKAEAPQSVVN